MERELTLSFCKKICSDCVSKLIVHLENPTLLADGTGMMTLSLKPSTPDVPNPNCSGSAVSYVVVYDDSLLTDPSTPLTECNVSVVCCHDCLAEYVDKSIAAAITPLDLRIVSIEATPTSGTDGIYVVTVSDGTNTSTFNADLSALLDDTTVTYTAALNVAPNVNELILTGSDGNNSVVDLCPAVQDCETVTSLVPGADGGSLDYSDEDGATHNIDLCPIVDHCETVTILRFNLDGESLDFIDEDDVTHNLDLCPAVKRCETLTTLEYVGGNIVYTDEDGGQTSIPMVEDSLFTITGGPDATTVESGPIDINNHDNIHFWPGNSLEVEVTPGSGRVQYGLVLSTDAGQLLDFGTDDNVLLTKEMVPLTELELVGSDLQYKDEVEVVTTIDLCPAVKICETVTTLTYDPALNRLTYTDEDDTQHVLDLIELNDTSVVTNTVAGNRIATHDDGDGTVVDIFETVTVLEDNGNNSFTYVDEAGVAVVIDYQETITDLQVNPSSTGLLYTNEDGQVQDIDICPLVENCETVTSLAYDANTDTLTYTPEDGAATSLVLNDTKSTVINTILPGQRIATHDNGDGAIVDINETVTTLTDNGNNSFTYVAEDGVTTLVDFQETITDLQVNLTTTGIDYTNEAGVLQAIDLCPIVDNCETVTAISYVPATDTITYTDEDGVATNLVLDDAKSAITNIIDGNRIATHEDGDGVSVDIDETITTVIDNGNDSFTYVNEAGTPTVIDYKETLTGIAYNGATGDLTYTDENGDPNVVNIPIENFLELASYDPNTNDLTLTLTDGTVLTVNLGDLVDPETLTTLVDNGNDTFTYVNEAGTAVTVDYSHPDDVITALAINPAVEGLLYTDEVGTVTALDLCPIVKNCETLTGISIAASTISYLDEAGAQTDLDLCPAVQLCETITTFVDNGDETFTYTSEDGTSTTVDITHPPETVTTLTNNGNGSFTYVNEDGVAVTVTFAETVTDLQVNATTTGLNYTNEDGTIQAIDLCPIVDNCETVTAIQLVGDVITYSDEDGDATDLELGPVIRAEETITRFIYNGDGSITYVNEDATEFNIVPDLLVDNGNNSFTHTQMNGGNSVTVGFEHSLSTPGGISTILTLTQPDGTLSQVDLCPIIANCPPIGETALTMLDADGFTYTQTGDANHTVETEIVVDPDPANTLTVGPDGFLVVGGDPSVVTPIVQCGALAGRTIAEHESSDGTEEDIQESVTTLVDTGTNTAGGTNIIRYTSEDCTETDFCEGFDSFALREITACPAVAIGDNNVIRSIGLETGADEKELRLFIESRERIRHADGASNNIGAVNLNVTTVGIHTSPLTVSSAITNPHTCNSMVVYSEGAYFFAGSWDANFVGVFRLEEQIDGGAWNVVSTSQWDNIRPAAYNGDPLGPVSFSRHDVIAAGVTHTVAYRISVQTLLGGGNSTWQTQALGVTRSGLGFHQ